MQPKPEIPAIASNLRHLRLFLAVADCGSLTKASEACYVSQPAVTQAISKLETSCGGPLLERTRQGVLVNDRGRVLVPRIRRATELLTSAFGDVAPRLIVTITMSQLVSLIAVHEAENFTLAARLLGVAQPTVHRAVSQIENVAGRALFQRGPTGLVATRAADALARAARLALVELEQAAAELAEFDGVDAGRMVIGALPLSRSVLLPQALAAFRVARPKLAISVVDGTYADLLAGLRRGDVDLIVGALRDPAPIGDIVQTPLFSDRVAFVAPAGDPLAQARDLELAALSDRQWVVPRSGTPTRTQFDAYFRDRDLAPPESLIECGSILFMREMLGAGAFLGCISEHQAAAELKHGLLSRLDVRGDWPARPIGVTTRAGWVPTTAQQHLIDTLKTLSAKIGER